MVSLSWCLKQKKGIRLINRKDNLSKDYMERAEESLKVCKSSTGSWRIIAGYYACYESLYSILMKCGIKCEIHDCTINLMKFFDFTNKDINFMKDLKDKRIRVQYYLGKEEVSFNDVKKFVLKCEKILESLNMNLINLIRGKLK